MKVAVQDANILIDLELSGLLGIWFQLGIETHTTDLIIEQVREGGHDEVLANAKSGRLHVHTCSADQIAGAIALAELYPGIDLEDGSVCLLAIDLNATLLTGDRRLRVVADAKHVDVHGTLWIFDRMIEGKILSPNAACDKLEKLLDLDRYLPRLDCEKRLQLWRIGSEPSSRAPGERAGQRECPQKARRRSPCAPRSV